MMPRAQNPASFDWANPPSYEEEERKGIQGIFELAGSEATSEAERLLDPDQVENEHAEDSTPGRSHKTAIFSFLSVDELRAPIPPVTYAIQAFDMCPGRPTMIIGTGYSGKTLFGMSILLAAASGRQLWDRFDVASGPVVHLDYEMGKNPVLRRYQRIAYAIGLDFGRDVAPHLSLASNPRLKVNSPGAREALLRACDGKKICLIDSLRRSIPGADENDNRTADHIDMLQPISNETGCTFIILHHASTKPATNGDPRAAGRGASAFYDAAGAVLLMRGRPGEPIQVTQTRAMESGEPCEDFSLRFEDVADEDGRPKAGLRIAYMGALEAPARESAGQRTEDPITRIVAAVERAGTKGLTGGLDAIALAAGIAAMPGREAARSAITSGQVVERKHKPRDASAGTKRVTHYYTPRNAPPDEGPHDPSSPSTP